MNQIIKEGQDQITTLITAGEPISISDARAIAETVALAAVAEAKKEVLAQIVYNSDGSDKSIAGVVMAMMKTPADYKE